MSRPRAVLSNYQTQDGTDQNLSNRQSRTCTLRTLKHVRKERRKAQKASGKAHVVKKRIMKIEDHFDDC